MQVFFFFFHEITMLKVPYLIAKKQILSSPMVALSTLPNLSLSQNPRLQLHEHNKQEAIACHKNTPALHATFHKEVYNQWEMENWHI